MIDTWFPTSIFNSQLNTNKYDLGKIVKRVYEIKNTVKSNTGWRCDTYSTFNTYNILEDDAISPILGDLFPMVEEFARYFNVETNSITCSEGWVNVAPPGEYQEYHVHPRNHFSAVVYLKTPPNCGNIVFKSFSSDGNMFDLPLNSYNKINSETCAYEPFALKVLIFRSNLLHMVEKNKSKEDRISVSFNFVLNKT
jgi:uncharacterized protein (TIGR02466 family)